jgi:hypothetical protein
MHMPRTADPKETFAKPDEPLPPPLEAEVRAADLVGEEPSDAQASPESQREDRIREAAYAAYERRGREPGHEQEDWLDAERTLERDQTTTPATPAQNAMKQFSKTAAESDDLVGPNDGPATTRQNQPVRPGDAGVGQGGNEGSSPYQDRSRPEEPERDA